MLLEDAVDQVEEGLEETALGLDPLFRVAIQELMSLARLVSASPAVPLLRGEDGGVYEDLEGTPYLLVNLRHVIEVEGRTS